MLDEVRQGCPSQTTLQALKEKVITTSTVDKYRKVSTVPPSNTCCGLFLRCTIRDACILRDHVNNHWVQALHIVLGKMFLVIVFETCTYIIYYQYKYTSSYRSTVPRKQRGWLDNTNYKLSCMLVLQYDHLHSISIGTTTTTSVYNIPLHFTQVRSSQRMHSHIHTGIGKHSVFTPGLRSG